MGEKFSWDKLLKRKKRSDNTIEMNPNEAPMPPVAPLMSTDSISQFPVQKQVNGPDIDFSGENFSSQTPPQNPPQNKAPLIIDWEAYRAQSESSSAHAPVSEFEMPVAPAVDAPVVLPTAFSEPPVSVPAPLVTEAPGPVLHQTEAVSPPPASLTSSWADVELTPAESASLEYQVLSAPNDQELSVGSTLEVADGVSATPPVTHTPDFFAPAPPAASEEFTPVVNVPSWPEDDVFAEAAPIEQAQFSDVAPVQEESSVFESVEPTFVHSASCEPVDAATAQEVFGVDEPVEQPRVEVHSNAIPDIFAKAMGLIPASTADAPAEDTESPVDAPKSSWMPSSHTPSEESADASFLKVETAEVQSVIPIMPTVTEEPVNQFPVAAPAEPDPNAVPEEYQKAEQDIEIQKGRDKRLGDLLLENRLITQRQLDRALERQVETKEKLGVILVAMQTMSERRLIQVLAAQKGVSPWHLEEDLPSEEALKLVPEDMCRIFQVLPVAVRGDLLLLAMRDPNDAEAIENIRSTTKMRIEPVMADEARLAYTIDNAYGISKARRAVAIDKYVAEAMAGFEEFRRQNPDVPQSYREEDTRPVVGLVNHIIEEAIRMQASDIHFEPREDKAEIRYRLDGQLMKMRDFPAELLPLVNARIKIMADLDLADLKNPQDGRTDFKYGSNVVGLRVSVLPNIHGDRIVMRVLDKTVGLRAMDKLGFEDQNLQMFRELISKPYGLFLVTGPTGSGKTTTLYAALDELKESATNIMTCEDPVEYDLGGINQAEVNERSGLTFGKQLKAILRQDPDVVLIGEIRDAETAEIAIRAATSGHMVMATLHCNDAAAAIPRLIDLGVDAHTLGSALTGTLSQRLIRVLCPSCKTQEAPTLDEQNILTKYFGLEGVESVWHAPGCNDCMNTGFKGRTAVHEVLPVTEDISALIESGAKSDVIKREAAYYGYLPMQQDAISRVLSGQTTVDEARRVLMFDTIEKRSAPRKIEVPKAS